MGDWSRFRPIVLIPLALAALVLLSLPRTGGAAPHNLGNDCYACHNIRSGQVWQGSYSVWSGKPIGMSTYGRAITCEVCHTNYGTGRFTASSASHHPVQVISGTSMATDNWTTTLVMCKDCHNADSVTLTPNLNPDLAPTNYTSVAGNTPLDGYPNHDVTSPDNQVNAGDPPHLLAMRLSAGQRTLAGSGTYTRLPSSAPATDYAFCFSCHDGSNNTSRGASDNILAAYVTKGHYFKSAAPTGGAINDRIPCSDCHASHNSVTNARLFEPDNTTWTGTRPTGLTMASEASPTAAETRAICIFCHEDYSVADTTTTSKRVRTVQPIRRRYGVAGHAPTDTQSCNQCHNTHNPPAGGDDCLNCHRTGGSVLAKHQMTDLEFPADGTPGEDNAALQVSGHKGVLYTTPYNTKALNECKKCHGTSHPTDAAKVQAADGTTTWPTGFVYGLSWSGSAWSANAASFLDTNANNIIDGNEFCLSCHDGNDALSPTDNANIRIGGVNPPVVWFPSGGQSTGHDRKSGSTYPVSGNAPAQQLCTSCHKYHTSDRPQLFPGNLGPFGAGSGYTYAMPTWAGIGTNWQAPRPATSVFPSNAGRVVIGTVNANLLNFTDRSLPSSGKGFGTAGAKAGTDGFCNACHRDAATVTAGTLNTAHTHEGDNTAFGSGNTFVKDCVECHNPHGGGTTPNISMIRQTVGRDNTTQNAVVFSARTGANSFDENDGAVESNLDDLCATCHNGPSPIAHNYRTFAGAANHYQGAACTSCHPHGQTDNAAKFGFPQGSCTTCHGNATNGTFWPDNTAAGAAYPNRTGAHVKHIDAIYARNAATLPGADNVSKKNSTCDWCHPNPGGTNHDNNSNSDNTADVHRDPYNPTTHFKTILGATNGAVTDNYAPATHSCGTVDCHYRTPTPTNGWVNPPVAMTCASCHPASGSSFDNTKLPNAHVTHASSTAKGYSCGVCHPSGTYTMPHQTGRVNLDFTNTLDPGGTRTELASGSDNLVKYGTAGGYATCSVFYCHGNFSPGGLSATPRWDNVASGDCGTCHMGNGTAGNLSVINTGNHTAHLDNGATAVGPKFGNANCQVCHTGWTLTDNTHVAGALTFRNDNASVAWSVLGATAPLLATDNTSTDRCTGCHSTTNIAGVGVGTVLAKTSANWDNNAYKLDCRTCHNAAYPSWDNVGKTGVRAPGKDTNWTLSGHGLASGTYNGTGSPWPGASPNPGAMACTTCHDQAKLPHISHVLNDGDRLFVPADSPALAYTDNVSRLCYNCHDPAQSSARTRGYLATSKATVHSTGVTGRYNAIPATYRTYGDNTNYATYPGYQCSECHDVHGTTKIAMVLDNIVSKIQDNTTARAVTAAFNYAGGTLAGGLDPSATANDGVCDLCHGTSVNVNAHDNTNHVNNHNYAQNCATCHLHNKSFQASCTGCHGNTTNNTIWPDNTAVGAAYPTRAGAHPKHVTAIANARGVSGNTVCTVCHPGNPPAGHPTDNTSGASQAEVNRMDTNNDNVANYWATNYFSNMAGGSDTAGFYRTADDKCSSLACHGGSLSLNWYYVADTAPPVWASGMNISATDCVVGGTLQVQWARAVDAFPSNPVRYDLYGSATNTAAAVYTSVPVYTDLLDNVAIVSGLVNATSYYFGVRGKDSWPVPNVTTDNTISAARAPTGGVGVVTTTYFLSKWTGTVWGTTAENMPACGATAAFAAGTTLPPPGLGLLSTTKACTNNVTNYISNSSPANAVENWVGFYDNVAFARDTLVTGQSTGNNFGARGSAGGEILLISLAAVTNAGVHTLSTDCVAITLTTVLTAYTPDLSTLHINVPATQRIGVLFRWDDTNTTVSTSDQMTIDAYSTTMLNQIVLTKTPNDNAAPAWAGGVSGIAAVDNQIGGAIRVSWNTATDAYPSNPVTYDLYRSDNVSTLWSTLHASYVGVTTILDTGLTNGTRYYYGVRAKDSATPPNVTTNIDNASAIPTGGAGVQSCTACHGMPPASDPRNAGSHVKHVPTGSPATACNRCHPGTSSYGYGHQDGKGKLGFRGVSVLGNYAGNSLTYVDNGTTIYSDTTGYGFLTGVAGDNTDNGTCSVTVCHGSATPVWGGAAIPCGTCHGTTGRTGYTDTSTDPAGAPPFTIGGGTEYYKVGQHLKHLNVSYGNTGDSCNVCHNTAGKGTVHHGDNAVDVIFNPVADNGTAGSATYTDNLTPGPGTCSGLSNTGCHGTARWDNTAVLTCAQCHTSITTHTTRNGSTGTCTDCHPGGAKYPTRHSDNGNPRVVLIPNYATVGINTSYGGIHLGGDNTFDNGASTTEAQICWTCHTGNTPMISEWGSNPNANTGNMAYDYGIVCTSNTVLCDNSTNKAGWQPDWTKAWWRSGNDNIFAYKRGRIQSTHTANPSGTAAVTFNATDNTYYETLDNVSNIRCSYCHDVHNRNLAPGDTVSGVPYLRGTWRGNPYKEDGAPHSTSTYATYTGNKYGAVPRGGTAYTNMGGYFIGQNPTGGSTDNAAGEGSQSLSTFAGLCTLCHGSNVDSMDYTPSENLWVGTNGHSATVIGGSGSAKHNIFDYTHGRPAPVFTNGSRNYSNHVPSMGLKGATAGYSYRGSQGGSYVPVISGSPYAFRSYNWGATVDNTTTDYPYHKFTCAKCHNPHASRLPKLMITNCLDIRHNTWQTGKTLQSKYTAATLTDKGKLTAYYDSAQNCHRYDDGQAAKNPGWNKVSPWK